MSPHGLDERFSSQPNALEPWNEVGRLKGLSAVKGDPIPWVVKVLGNGL